MSEKMEALRARVRRNSENHSKNALELAWDLGPIFAESAWRNWKKDDGGPIISFDDYLKHDCGGHVKRSEGYALAKIGVTFHAHKPKINELVATRQIGIVNLIEASSAVGRGLLDPDTAVKHLEYKIPIKTEQAGDDPDGIVKVEIFVKRGDWANFQKGRLYYALRNFNDGVNDLDIAVIHWALGEVQNPMLPPRFEKWLHLIEAGEFLCRCCGKIPAKPTEHHFIPQSLAKGHGPTALLCWTPCHRDIVQPHWRYYAEQWLGGKRKFMALRREIEEKLGEKLEIDEK